MPLPALLASLSLVLLAAPPAAALLPGEGWPLEAPVPLPMGSRCGFTAGPAGFNCARLSGEGGMGPCVDVPGGWDCPFEFAVTVDSYWWKNAGGLVATLHGSCSAETRTSWDLPFMERRDEARCTGTFFVPNQEGCWGPEVAIHIAFSGQDAPAGEDTGMGMGICIGG